MDERELTKQVALAQPGDADALQRLLVHYHAPLRATVAAGIAPALARRLDPDDVLQQAYIKAFQALADPNRDRERAAAPDPNPERQRGPALDPSPPREQGPPPDPSRDRQGATNPASDRQEANNLHFESPGGLYKWLERIALNELKNQLRALQRQKRDINREIRAGGDTRASYPGLIQRIAASESTPSRTLARDEAIAAVMSSLARLTDDQRAVVRLRFLEGRSVPETAAALGKTEEAIHALCYRSLKALRDTMESITHYLTRL